MGGGRLAGRYKRRKPDQAGRYKIFLMWGGGGGPAVLSVSSGTDTFESVQHHYAQEIISLSTILHTGNNESRITLNGITV